MNHPDQDKFLTMQEVKEQYPDQYLAFAVPLIASIGKIPKPVKMA